MSRRTAIIAATLAATFLAAPAASIAGPTQTFDAGAELLRQPKGKPWEMNLFVAAKFGTDDGSPVSAVRKMRMSFPSGARYNGDAFKTCSLSRAERDACPKGSQIGTGLATALLGTDEIDAKIKVFNGPGTAKKRKVFLYSRALSTVEFTLQGTMRKTRGTYGYVLDVDVPPIVPVLFAGGIPIVGFETTIGGNGRKKGKRVPLVSSPTSCKGGWKFAATFTYANGSSGTVNSAIPCRLAATPL